jgi:hypothetical protein
MTKRARALVCRSFCQVNTVQDAIKHNFRLNVPRMTRPMKNECAAGFTDKENLDIEPTQMTCAAPRGLTLRWLGNELSFAPQQREEERLCEA